MRSQQQASSPLADSIDKIYSSQIKRNHDNIEADLKRDANRKKTRQKVADNTS